MKELLVALYIGFVPVQDTPESREQVDFYCFGAEQVSLFVTSLQEHNRITLNHLLNTGCGFFSDIFGGNYAYGQYIVVGPIPNSDYKVYEVRFPNNEFVYTYR